MKILYFMHIEWNWIRQRPHFIAEGLRDTGVADTLVAYETSFRTTKRTKNISRVKRLRLIPVPKKRVGILKKLDILLNSAFLRLLVKIYKPDYLWISHPNQVNYTKSVNLPIIYDCMDDHLEFDKDGKFNNLMKFQEQEVCRKAQFILVSSQTLRNRLIERYRVDGAKIDVVNNGVGERIISNLKYYFSLKSANKDFIEILYFGTVGNWFDFSIVNDILTNCNNVKFVVIGPMEITPDQNDRIIFLGPMNHESMMMRAAEADVLIMPFKLNDLILGVDPVKMYEYVAFNKAIISVQYDEVEKFGHFTYFWPNEKSRILDDIRDGYLKPKGNFEDRKEFLESNNWYSRIMQIKGILKE